MHHTTRAVLPCDTYMYAKIELAFRQRLGSESVAINVLWRDCGREVVNMKQPQNCRSYRAPLWREATRLERTNIISEPVAKAGRGRHIRAAGSHSGKWKRGQLRGHLFQRFGSARPRGMRACPGQLAVEGAGRSRQAPAGIDPGEYRLE